MLHSHSLPFSTRRPYHAIRSLMKIESLWYNYKIFEVILSVYLLCLVMIIKHPMNKLDVIPGWVLFGRLHDAFFSFIQYSCFSVHIGFLVSGVELAYCFWSVLNTVYLVQILYFVDTDDKARLKIRYVAIVCCLFDQNTNRLCSAAVDEALAVLARLVVSAVSKVSTLIDSDL